MYINKIFSLIFVPFLLLGTPNIEWFQQYNGSGEESHGHYIMTCDDGGYLQIGESNFLPNDLPMK